MIVLSKTAPWATPTEIRDTPRLRNGYRERFAFVDGRRFRVEAESLYASWWLEEVDERGEALWTTDDGAYVHGADLRFGVWAHNLAEVRTAIAAYLEAAGVR